MKVCGFTFVRNGAKFDYPILESIHSILPICDCFIVAVGNSDDRMLELIQSIKSSKIKIIETVWDDSLREGGRVLAVETDKSFQAIPDEYDWAFYLQADEVVHEQSLPAIKKAMEENFSVEKVEGFFSAIIIFMDRMIMWERLMVGAEKRYGLSATGKIFFLTAMRRVSVRSRTIN